MQHLGRKPNSAPGACEIQLDLSVPVLFFCTRIYEYPNLASAFPSALCYRHLDVCTWLFNVTVTLYFKELLINVIIFVHLSSVVLHPMLLLKRQVLHAPTGLNKQKCIYHLSHNH